MPAFALLTQLCAEWNTDCVVKCRQSLEGTYNSSMRKLEGSDKAESVCGEHQDVAQGLRQAVPADHLKALRNAGFEADATRHVINHADVR